jgi:bacterioferritin-associated ferredoxin
MPMPPRITESMSPDCPKDGFGGCSTTLVCRCLKITEARLIEALTSLGVRTIAELRAQTGAGDGCTACHKILQQYLHRHAFCLDPQPEPVGRIPLPACG